MASSTYDINLNENISGPANAAAAALKNLQTRIDADRTALRALEKEMKALQRAAVVDIETFRSLQSAIDDKRASIDRTRSAIIELGSSQLKAGAASVNLRGRIGEVSRVAQALPGALGGPIDRLAKLTDIMVGAVPPTIALRVGIVALSAVLVAGSIAFARYAASQAAARQQEALHLQQLSQYKAGSAVIAALQGDIDAVSASVSIGRDDVAELGAQLAQSGLRGQSLRAALEGAAIKASALGKDAGIAFARTAAAAGQTTVSIERMADAVKSRFGGIVQQQMLSLEVQAKKTKEGVASLFSGLKVDGYLKALQQVHDQFDANRSVAGRALKTMIEAFGQPLINAYTAAMKAFKTFWVQVLIGVYEIGIGYQLLKLAWQDTFGKSETEGPFTAFFKQFQVGRVFVYVLAAAFAVLAVNVLAALAPFIAIGAAVYLLALYLQELASESLQLGAWLHGLVDAGEQAMEGLAKGLLAGWDKVKSTVLTIADNVTSTFKSILGISSPSTVFAGFGADMSDGLMNGLQARWDAVQSGVSNMANGLADTFASVLDIGSPSKVFEGLGADISMGVASGVERGTPQAQTAIDTLVDVPTVPATGATGATGANARAAGNVVTVTVGPIAIHAPAADAPTIASSLRRELETVLEGLAFEVGAEPAGAA